MQTRHDSSLRVGQLEIWPDEYVAVCAGRRLELTAREFALLTELARRSGRIVTREELFTAVWGREFRREDRSVDVYVRKLRAKLAHASPDGNFIHTHFGFGYRLEPETRASRLLQTDPTR